jgi:rhamnose utilization protein RhaD (predicted bifunctional aldolase and dehydrogenase)/NAD(P)-dependent dehydrogenase (short-subunit alcohol dehydrogenase family)
MQLTWDETTLKHVQDELSHHSTLPELADLVYASRLLGEQKQLVMHGGGNTSVKAELKDILGHVQPVILVKKSGTDLHGISTDGFVPLKLHPLLAIRDHFFSNASTDSLDSEVFKSVLIENIFYGQHPVPGKMPVPSIETLLHAFLPHKYILHTHAFSQLILSNQPNGHDLTKSVLGDQLGYVPYIKPGFELAMKAYGAYQQNPDIEGLVLLKHGLVTFGQSAMEAYEKMLVLVHQMDAYIHQSTSGSFPSVALPGKLAAAEDVATVLRGASAIITDEDTGIVDTFCLEFRSSERISTFVNYKDVKELSARGAMTPDFIVRTRNTPLVISAPNLEDMDAFRSSVYDAFETYACEFEAYVDRQSKKLGLKVDLRDKRPRVVLVPGLGLFGLGKNAKQAKTNADIAEASIDAILKAESIGRFESITEDEVFEIEFWDTEQAKVSHDQGHEFLGKVVLVTGAAGAIGLATAKAFQARGAEIAATDFNEEALVFMQEQLGPDALVLRCDVTNASDVASVFREAVLKFGGVDIVVSNVGIALQGRIGEVPDEVLRKSFEVNFFSHQSVAQQAVRIMKAQGYGGDLLFNVSKQAVNPGPDFGPYGLPKASTLFLVRQYALDHGRDKIRANGVNADRIRSGLLNTDMIKARSKARGLSESDYMRGNLLKMEVLAEDVAQAFVHLALEKKTTGSITTVDGGNIAAALR